MKQRTLVEHVQVVSLHELKKIVSADYEEIENEIPIFLIRPFLANSAFPKAL